MRFEISREALLKPLQLVSGVVEKRQALPVLSNVLFVAEQEKLLLTGTDLEVELCASIKLQEGSEPGAITVPGKKLMDICKSLPEQSLLEIKVKDAKVEVKSGRSRFVLSSLPASDFPNIKDLGEATQVILKQADLRKAIDRTSFAMAQQDVRYYLNGMLIEIKDQSFRTVSTDGHRLATCVVDARESTTAPIQIIVPRKAILEMSKLVLDPDAEVVLDISNNHMRVTAGDYVFTSKLVDGKFPDYERVIPRNGTRVLLGNRQELKQVFYRTAILSNEKYRRVRLFMEGNSLQVIANNPEQEQAEETLGVDYQAEPMEVSFNVSYLQDVLSVLESQDVKVTMSDSLSPALVQAGDTGEALYVVMPMRV
jgi:DNA polymerase-3 subunit beta